MVFWPTTSSTKAQRLQGEEQVVKELRKILGGAVPVPGYVGNAKSKWKLRRFVSGRRERSGGQEVGGDCFKIAYLFYYKKSTCLLWKIKNVHKPKKIIPFQIHSDLFLHLLAGSITLIFIPVLAVGIITYQDTVGTKFSGRRLGYG